MKTTIAITLLVVTAGAYAASIQLKDGQHIETGLADARLVAQLASSSGKAYLLIAGRDCIECDENTSLYLGELNSDKLPEHMADRRNDYPGTLKDYESGEVVQVVRVFFGHCISDAGDQVIWFEESKTDSGKTMMGEYLTTLERDGPHSLPIPGKQPDLERVLIAAKSKACREIPGIDGATEP